MQRESLRPSSDASIVTPPGVSLFLTARNITGVIVFPGLEDSCCSCSWSTRGSTSLALIPPTPECLSSSSPVGSSRVLLCPSSDACIVPSPNDVLFLTMSYVNEVRRGVVLPGQMTLVVLVLSQRAEIHRLP